MIYSTKRNENLIIDFKQPNKAAQILNANNGKQSKIGS